MTSSVAAASGAPVPIWRRAFDWWLVQVKHMLPPTIFFFFGFNLILFTRWMTLKSTAFRSPISPRRSPRCWSARRCWWLTLRFMSRFDGAPLIQPILFKSTIYWLWVFVFRSPKVFPFLRDGSARRRLPRPLVAQFSWPRSWRSRSG
jgi:hypothetical protein